MTCSERLKEPSWWQMYLDSRKPAQPNLKWRGTRLLGQRPVKTSTPCGETQAASTSAPAADLPLSSPKWNCGCAVDGSKACNNFVHQMDLKVAQKLKAVTSPGAWLASLSSKERKEVAVSRGLAAYFPDALALVARHSVRANEKHNPGQPVHWAREKSTDHEDCILRHSMAVAVDPDSLDDGAPHVVCRAWRALAALQVWAEAKQAKGEKL